MQQETLNYIALIDLELKNIEIELQNSVEPQPIQIKNINSHIKGLKDLKNACVSILKFYEKKQTRFQGSGFF